MDKKLDFMTIVVIATLVYVIISVIIYTMLQIYFDIDPTPHYDFLKIVVPVELMSTAGIKIAGKWVKSISNNEIFEDESEQEEIG